MPERADSAERDLVEGIEMIRHQRDLGELARGVANWLRGPLGADGEVVVEKAHCPGGGGMSSVSMLTDATWTTGGQEKRGKFVTRLAPEDTSFPVFPAYDLRMQHDVMAGVRARSDVPVPPLVGIEDTGTVVGAPFVVMEHVEGRLPLDNPPYTACGWLFEATEAQRRQLQDATLGVLARIHAIPDPAEAFPFLSTGEYPLRDHLEATRAYYEWTRREDRLRIPILERAFERIEDTLPADPGETVLTWGDARPGNVIYDEFTPRAVLDWEMAALGPRELDLGWFIFIHRFFQDIVEAFAVPGLPDLARRGDVVATYESLTGHRVRDLDWYILYAALRHGVVMSQIRRRMIHFGEADVPADVDEYVMHHEAITKLLDGTYEWPAS